MIFNALDNSWQPVKRLNTWSWLKLANLLTCCHVTIVDLSTSCLLWSHNSRLVELLMTCCHSQSLVPLCTANFTTLKSDVTTRHAVLDIRGRQTSTRWQTDQGNLLTPYDDRWPKAYHLIWEGGSHSTTHNQVALFSHHWLTSAWSCLLVCLLAGLLVCLFASLDHAEFFSRRWLLSRRSAVHQSILQTFQLPLLDCWAEI